MCPQEPSFGMLTVPLKMPLTRLPVEHHAEAISVFKLVWDLPQSNFKCIAYNTTPGHKRPCPLPERGYKLPLYSLDILLGLQVQFMSPTPLLEAVCQCKDLGLFLRVSPSHSPANVASESPWSCLRTPQAEGAGSLF